MSHKLLTDWSTTLNTHYDQFKHGLRAATKKFWCATSKKGPDPMVEPSGKDASCDGGGADKEK